MEMMKNTSKTHKKAQAVFEYLVIFAIIVIGIISSGFVPNIKTSFSNHFDDCVEVILE